MKARWLIVEQQNWNHCLRNVGDDGQNEGDDDDDNFRDRNDKCDYDNEMTRLSKVKYRTCV